MGPCRCQFRSRSPLLSLMGNGHAAAPEKISRRSAFAKALSVAMKLGDFLANLRGGKRPGDDRNPLRASAARSVDSGANYPFHAVSIKPGLLCCQRASKLRGIRFLSRAAPSIPLPQCEMGKECTCRFEKHNDRRRGGDRRLFGSEPDGRYYSGNERRHTGRRSSDSQQRAS